MAAVAELEAGLISQRTKAALRQAKAVAAWSAQAWQRAADAFATLPVIQATPMPHGPLHVLIDSTGLQV
jgi:hypothetical protein